MRREQEKVRYAIGVLLALFTVVTAVYLWLLDLLSRQGVFGALLASELVAFAMLVHVYTKPSFSRAWMVAGCAVLALFLTIALRGASS